MQNGIQRPRFLYVLCLFILGQCTELRYKQLSYKLYMYIYMYMIFIHLLKKTRVHTDTSNSNPASQRSFYSFPLLYFFFLFYVFNPFSDIEECGFHYFECMGLFSPAAGYHYLDHAVSLVLTLTVTSLSLFLPSWFHCHLFRTTASSVPQPAVTSLTLLLFSPKPL